MVNQISISKAEIFLISILLTFGIPMVLLIPPGAGYDEEDHLVRVWEISGLSFIPGEMSPKQLKYPIIFRDLAYRQQASAGIIDANFWQTYAGVSLDEHGYVRREINTKSVYSPALFLPQSITMRYFGRIADLPALPVFYLTRFAGLLSYLFLVWLAIRIIPFGKWLLLILAVSPMALFQATTLTADTISNGIGFLFIAGSLNLAQFEEIDWKKTGKLLLLVFLLLLTKLNVIFLILLPFVLISPSRYRQRWIYLFIFVISVILFIVEVAAWNVIATRNIDALLANDANVPAQLQHILRHPLHFLWTVMEDFIINGSSYLETWINGYGYYYWTPPQIVSICFLLSLGSVLLISTTTEGVDKRFNILFIVVFVLGYLATIVLMYLTFTPVGSDKILGPQGRYFIPSAMLLFLALSSLSAVKKLGRPSITWGMGFLVAALSINLMGIILAFYVPCGTTFYNTELCYQPPYKDFTAESHPSPPISNEISVTQEVQVRCDGFTELRVLLFPSISQANGTTRFILQDPMNDQKLLDTLVQNDQITSEDWYPLRFNPDWHSNGKQYVLKVLSTGTLKGQGLRLFYSAKPEFQGNLYENGQLMQGGVALQYGCITGIRKLWLTGGL
ncbi:MAG TPA: DUF2142 domain-containing protein [Anaerolineales bacterium]|nr:DUF2142 domain-containing protein [Anaerolineales bacterium]